ncbi:MAG: nuclease-related domain-containing protein [bacterium]
MAQVFGERSKYLIWMDYASRIAAILVYIMFLYTLYSYISINFTKTASVLSILVATAMYLPLILWIKKELGNYIRSAFNFRIGRIAEYEICDELSNNLSEDFLIFQDVKIGGKIGNIDLVVIGKNGAFALEVKSHSGKMTFNGFNLLRNDFNFREKNVLKQTMDEAVDLSNHIKNKTGKYYFIEPVLVFSSKWAFMRFGFNKIKGVHVVQKRFLNELILRSPECLTNEDVEFLKKELIELVHVKN